jgi:hypothetical protein
MGKDSEGDGRDPVFQDSPGMTGENMKNHSQTGGFPGRDSKLRSLEFNFIELLIH